MLLTYGVAYGTRTHLVGFTVRSLNLFGLCHQECCLPGTACALTPRTWCSHGRYGGGSENRTLIRRAKTFGTAFVLTRYMVEDTGLEPVILDCKTNVFPLALIPRVFKA
jgi:hypothetical protein